MIARFSTALLLLLAGVPVADAQAAPPATGIVVGHVICADTQQPARLAHVVLQPLVDLQSAVLSENKADAYRSEGTFHLQTVGLDGSFVIPAVPQGLYYVIAEQEGYVSPLAMVTRAELNKPDEVTMRKVTKYLTAISVTAGHTTQAEVRLFRGASVAGRVGFEDGSPAVGVGMALLHKDADGKWVQARTGQLASHSSSYTDDAGTYRFSGLPAGEYLVRASIELNNVVLTHIFAEHGATSYGDGYRLRVYPGDVFRVRDAKPVKLEEGESAAAVDVDVPLSRLHAVSGTVLHPNAAGPVYAAHVTLNFADGGDELASTDVSSEDGTFQFNFVPEGNYTMQVSKIADVQRTEVPMCPGGGCVPPTRTETKTIARYGNASLPVQLTGDMTGVVVQAKAAVKTGAGGAQ